MINEVLFGENNEKCWININSDNKEKGLNIYNKFGITEEILNYALDRNERARIEYDEILKMFILIFNIPKKEKSENYFETIPITFLVKNNYLITISNNKNRYVLSYVEKILEKDPKLSIFKLLFSSLVSVSGLFFPLIEEVDKERRIVNDKLRQKTTKANLLRLSDLEIGNVYLVSALTQNTILLEQVQKNKIFGTLTQIEKEQLDDALIESKQIVEMISLSSKILKQSSITYNSILNNNLNDSMKLLTVLSVLLTVPTIITGFFGMNMSLPFEKSSFGWEIVVVISIISWFGLAIILSKRLKD